MTSARIRLASPLLGLALVATGCSTMGGGEDSAEPAPSAEGATGSGRVVLLTHESFALPKKLVRQFERESGYDLVPRATGDAGELTAKLSLTADNPVGDVAFGVDNTFASRPLDEGVFAAHDAELPPGAEQYALPEGADRLAPVDVAHVCVNVDTAWFDEQGLRPPRTLADLTKPAYEGLFVTPAASTSSPGMAFLLSTIAEHGDGWQGYWQDLVAGTARPACRRVVEHGVGREQGGQPFPAARVHGLGVVVEQVLDGGTVEQVFGRHVTSPPRG